VTALLLAIIFVSGAVVGGGVVAMYETQEPWPRPRRTLDERTDRMTERIGEKLELDREQREILRGILYERFKKWDEIRQTVLPRMEAQAQQINEQLRPHLSERQKQKWADLYRRLYQRTFEKDPPSIAENPPEDGQ
jgi:hypothetical protein